MLKRKAFIGLGLLALTFTGSVQAKEEGINGIPPVVVSPGTVVSEPASGPNKINCWTSRTSDDASAVHVYLDSQSVLRATLRRYVAGPEEYTSTPTKIVVPGVVNPVSLAHVPLLLTEVADHPRVYKMIYVVNPTTNVEVGYLRFGPGNTTRNTSDVVVRLNHSTVVGAVDPCGEPPIDDMGEEEEMPRGGGPAAPPVIPAASLPLTAN